MVDSGMCNFKINPSFRNEMVSAYIILKLSMYKLAPDKPLFLHEANNTYNFVFPASNNSAPPPAMQSLPVSTTLVWNKTLFPCFHISVRSVWPGNTVPANLTFTFLIMPNSFTTCFAEMPKKHSPCRIGTLNPPTELNAGSICSGFLSPDRR